MRKGTVLPVARPLETNGNGADRDTGEWDSFRPADALDPRTGRSGQVQSEGLWKPCVSIDLRCFGFCGWALFTRPEPGKLKSPSTFVPTSDEANLYLLAYCRLDRLQLHSLQIW